MSPALLNPHAALLSDIAAMPKEQRRLSLHVIHAIAEGEAALVARYVQLGIATPEDIARGTQMAQIAQSTEAWA